MCGELTSLQPSTLHFVVSPYDQNRNTSLGFHLRSGNEWITEHTTCLVERWTQIVPMAHIISMIHSPFIPQPFLLFILTCQLLNVMVVPVTSALHIGISLCTANVQSLKATNNRLDTSDTFLGCVDCAMFFRLFDVFFSTSLLACSSCTTQMGQPESAASFCPCAHLRAWQRHKDVIRSNSQGEEWGGTTPFTRLITASLSRPKPPKLTAPTAQDKHRALMNR